MGKVEEQVLANLELQTKINPETEEDDERLRNLEVELDELLRDEEPQFTQDEFLRFMDLTLNNSWDIPSALGTICHHLDLPEPPMHGRGWAEDPDNYQYPNLKPMFQGTAAAWDQLEPHFKQEHELDLTDSKINWDFDT